VNPKSSEQSGKKENSDSPAKKDNDGNVGDRPGNGTPPDARENSGKDGEANSGGNQGRENQSGTRDTEAHGDAADSVKRPGDEKEPGAPGKSDGVGNADSGKNAEKWNNGRGEEKPGNDAKENTPEQVKDKGKKESGPGENAEAAVGGVVSGMGVVTAVARNDAPDAFTLFQNSPNPFNPSTAIRYSLREDGRVSLAVYSVSGQKIRTLVDGVRPAGFHQARWDGRDDRGSTVAAGTYFARLVAGNYTRVVKMTLLK
jgi:hypothetical protein